MKIIDLTLPVYTGMPVYPGDPEASIEVIQTIENDGWNMRRIEINSHDGTHVNVPVHAFENGKTLDDYSLDFFMGPAKIYESGVELSPGTGVIFSKENIDTVIFEWIMNVKPHFVGLSCDFEIDIDIEKQLLKADIMLYERLANTKKLPNKFMFYGMPLHIKDGDGSPVRAFAIIE